jgi:PadR family transcriptional regulator AphA
MTKENKSKYALIGMLSICPGSGYDIKKFMECSTSNFWSESYGQIYPILKQLVEEGLAARHAEKQEGKPEKYIYTLTERGKEELRDWLSASVTSAGERISMHFRSFSHNCSKNTKISSAHCWLKLTMMQPSLIGS